MKGKKPAAWVLIAAAALFVLSCGNGWGGRRTPSDTVREFYNAFIAMRDTTLAARKPAGAVQNPTGKMKAHQEKLLGFFAEKKTAAILMPTFAVMRLKELKILDEKIEGDAATVRVLRTQEDFSPTVVNLPQSPGEVVFRLKRDKGRWIIEDIDGLVAKGKQRAQDKAEEKPGS